MGRAEAGSSKAIGNAIKAKGLGRLRWYCQVCEKQCRDENGFQAHCRSEPHLRKIIAVGPKAGQTIAEFSRQFQYEFITLLRTRHSTKRVQANKVYNEYIQDKHHVHMNATRWVTLTGFIQTIGKAGIVKVDEDDDGIWISWIDNSPKTLAKQASLQKRDRAEMDGEERERKMLEDQIARAKAQSDAAEQADQAGGLQKKEGEKISLNLNFGGASNITSTTPTIDTSSTQNNGGETNITTSSSSMSDPSRSSESETNKRSEQINTPNTTSISFGSLPSTSITTKPITNPLKRPAPMNIFKTAVSNKSAKTGNGDESSNSGKGSGPMSEVERLMKEDQARKAAKTQGYGGFGPRRETQGNIRR